MESVSQPPRSQDDTQSNPVFTIDFSWKKSRSLVTEQGRSSEPVYIIDFKALSSPHIIFRSAPDERIIGTGTIHAVSINANYEIHGRKGQLKALKRLATEYTYLSLAFSDDGTQEAMRWTANCALKTWDFICLDEQQMPVAKFSVNTFAAKKYVNIEFIGPKATSQDAQEEILITGMTLYQCMLLRCNNMFSLIGAAIASPGPLEKDVGVAAKVQ